MQISSKQLADDLQEVALKSGNVANVYMSCDNTGRPILDKDGIKKGQTNGPTYCITLLQPRKYQPILYVNLKTTNHLRGWYKEQYDGNVYCVEMPLVPVYVRRKGKAFWCMRTYKQLQDTTIRTFFDWYPPRHFGEYNKTDHNYIINAFKDIEVEIMFRALDRPDHVKNLLSLEITGCWINEAREIQQLIFWALDGRIGRYPAVRDGGCTWRGIIMDTNPPDEESWWYDLFEVKRPDNAKVFKQPSGLSSKAENLANLDQGRGYYENMAKGKDEMYVKVYVHGQYGYVLEGKPVFGSYRDNVHCANQILTPIRGLDLIVGMDFALQPTMVIGQIHPRGQLRTIDELLSDGMGLKQFCNNILLPHLRVNYHGFKIMGFGDPSGSSRAPTDESTCFDILHSPEIGLNYIIPAPTNALVPRIGAVEAFLNKMVDGEPGFLLSPKCSKLRKAMAGAYHYPEIKKQHGQFKEKPDPVKNDYSHVADALQEMCMYVDTKAADDLRNKAFLAQMQGRMGKHNVADKLSGY